MSQDPNAIRSLIWEEEPEADNPFAARACYCHGYDVYGDLLGKASWVEYLLLLLSGEKPAPRQAELLELLAVALADPGPRDHSIRAAMNGGVGGSGAAASLMAALAVGAGRLGGAREVHAAVQWWRRCGLDLDAWETTFAEPPREELIDVWPDQEHPPGFDPNGVSCPTPVRRTLEMLAERSTDDAIVSWLNERREALESMAGMPLAMSGVAAALFVDLGLSDDQAEMLYLLLRLPGAAAHALEQRHFGWRRYPFWSDGLDLTDDPGPWEAADVEGGER